VVQQKCDLPRAARIRQRGEGKVLGKDCKAGVFQIGMRSRHNSLGGMSLRPLDGEETIGGKRGSKKGKKIHNLPDHLIGSMIPNLKYGGVKEKSAGNKIFNSKLRGKEEPLVLLS